MATLYLKPGWLQPRCLTYKLSVNLRRTTHDPKILLSPFSLGSREPSNLDRDRDYFADYTKQLMEPAEMPDVTRIPTSLRYAAELWLAVMEAKMGKESYKVVPSKIHAFLEVVGDMPTS